MTTTRMAVLDLAVRQSQGIVEAAAAYEALYDNRMALQVGMGRLDELVRGVEQLSVGTAEVEARHAAIHQALTALEQEVPGAVERLRTLATEHKDLDADMGHLLTQFQRVQ
ncbi:MAG: hypothetical protein OWV35_10325 [Firmicutes bacterium]|nr:hypothetical protein [Bacillota bacterium]